MSGLSVLIFLSCKMVLAVLYANKTDSRPGLSFTTNLCTTVLTTEGVAGVVLVGTVMVASRLILCSMPLLFLLCECAVLDLIDDTDPTDIARPVA